MVRGGCPPPREAETVKEQVSRALEKHYAGESENIQDLVAEMAEDETMAVINQSDVESIDLESMKQMAQAAPVIKMVNLYLYQAIKAQSSDVHFEPFEDTFIYCLPKTHPLCKPAIFPHPLLYPRPLFTKSYFIHNIKCHLRIIDPRKKFFRVDVKFRMVFIF